MTPKTKAIVGIECLEDAILDVLRKRQNPQMTRTIHDELFDPPHRVYLDVTRCILYKMAAQGRVINSGGQINYWAANKDEGLTP